MSDIYNDLGVKKIINAAGTYTVLGGSRMSEKTLEDVRAAAGSFVRIRDLQAKINAEIAKIAVRKSRVSVMLMDRSKLGTMCSYDVCSTDQLDGVILF